MVNEGLLSRLTSPWEGFWAPSWSRRERWGGRWFPTEMFLIGLFLVVAPYLISNSISHHFLETVWDPEAALDRQIPPVYWMILPYSALYLFYPVTLALGPRDDRGRAELAVGMQALISATILCTSFHLVMPAEVDLRDQLDWDSMNAWQTSMFELIHSSDNPWNAWPSLHVVHAYFLTRMMTMWVVREYKGSSLAKPFLVLLWLEFALLSSSIMTTKQHYAFDFVTGVAMGHLVWAMCRPQFALIESKGPQAFAEEAGWV